MKAYGKYKDNIDLNNEYDVDKNYLGLINKRRIGTIRNLQVINRWKVNHDVDYNLPLAGAVIGIKNTDIRQYSSTEPARFASQTAKPSMIDANELFLERKATSYLIVGKPGVGTYQIGEAMSQQLKCVHLCPRKMLIEEIEQNSATGQCLDFNLKHYKICNYDTIMNLLKMKIQSPVVKHRGYVLSGFPLVTSSRQMQCFFNQMHAEDSLLVAKDVVNELIINMKKKKKKRAESPESFQSVLGEHIQEEEEKEEEEETVQEEVEEEEDATVQLPSCLLEPSNGVIISKRNYYDPKKASLIRQFNALFKLDFEPDILIYVTCPDEDVVTKKNYKYLNYKTSMPISDPILDSVEGEHARWPTKYTINVDKKSTSNDYHPKYNCKQPFNFKNEATEQICNYREIILPFLEKKINDFNPKYVIKLDGRTSLEHMMKQITQRIGLLHKVNPVIIPEPLNIQEPSEEIEEFWNSIMQGDSVKSNDVNFNIFPSLLYNRCPVELTKRRTVRGKPKYAVRYLKHVYLLSSLDALIKFWKNPRPYLHMTSLEPVCRIVVTGTTSSGKTMISECLSWIFDAPIIDYKIIEEKENAKKSETFRKSVLSELIATIEESRYAIWQDEENKRLAALEEWEASVLPDLKTYINIHTKYEKYLKDNHGKVPGGTLMESYSALRSKLQSLTILDALEICKKAVAQNSVKDYAPENIKNETKKPEIPVLGDSDVEQAISNYINENDLQNEMKATPEQISTAIIEIISTIDKDSLEINDTYGKFIVDGFTSDPIYWEILSDAKLLPDNTIAIIENREIDVDLIDNYDKLERCMKVHQERFLLADDPLIKIKLNKIKLPKSKDTLLVDIKKIVNDDIFNTLGQLFNEANRINEDIENEVDMKITDFSQSIENFREGWDSVKLRLEDNFKSFIEVEIDVKSDVEIVEDVLLKLRRSYLVPCEPSEDVEDVEKPNEEEDEVPVDMLHYNDPQFLCEIKTYCPIAYYDYKVLWEGKHQLCIKYNNRTHYFSKEECLEKFRKDPVKYEEYSKVPKDIFPLRVCVIGGTGSGKTEVSKFIAKEFGLVHVDFAQMLNDYLMPRHFKKVGRQYENMFTDIPSGEEAVVEFQMGEEEENLVFDIMSNESELRRMVFNYLERGSPLLPELLQKLLKKIWFDDPFNSTGFVLDGFPRVVNDVEEMLANFFIPDLVIECQCTSETAVARTSPDMFKQWKNQQNNARMIAKKKLENAKKEWYDFVVQNVLVKVTIDDLVDQAVEIIDPPYITHEASNASVMMDASPSGPLNMDPNLFNTYNEFIEQNPEPVDTNIWEKAEDARERIVSRIEGIFEGEMENIETLREPLNEENIRTVSVDATKSLAKVQRLILSKLSYLRKRICQSFFEQTFVVDLQAAEELLVTGYCFTSILSMCPVYIYEHPEVIRNPYAVGLRDNKIFPVIHRYYVYFLYGEDAVRKFRADPLKYVACKNIFSFHCVPMGVGVIGPPKSGKSSLASSLARKYGFICVSKGMAIRNILKNLRWTKLATEMKTALEAGNCISNDLIVQAVQTTLIDYRTYLYGFVFDGLPDTASEGRDLAKIGLYPHLIFDLICDKKTILKNSQKEIYFDIIKTLPPYSRPYIDLKYEKWQAHCYSIRDFIKDEYQNLTILNGNESRWQCLQNAMDQIENISPKLHNFAVNYKRTVVAADVMCISKDTFQERMSIYRNFCPICLRNNILKHNRQPVDKKGIVLYNDTFYWVCSEHQQMVYRNPKLHLRTEPISIPEIAVAIKNFHISQVYENGICIVCYAENLPRQVIKPGSNKYAASLKKKVYLLCNAKCLEKFMSRPYIYNEINVFKRVGILPKVTLKDLPDVGYLEQTMGNILTRACCAVNVIRPKYPGLDITLSGALFIALFLKVKSPLTYKDYLPFYKKALAVYEQRSKLILKVGLRMRSMDNPFVSYPECCPTNGSITDSCHIHKSSSSSLDDQKMDNAFGSIMKLDIQGSDSDDDK